MTLPSKATARGTGQADAGTPEPRFAFFEVVRVEDDIYARAHPTRQTGPIIGRAYWAEKQTWIYTLYFDEATFSFPEHQLHATGHKVERASIYDGSSIRVSCDGEILPDEEPPSVIPPERE